MVNESNDGLDCMTSSYEHHEYGKGDGFTFVATRKPVDEAWLRSIGFEKRDGWPLGIWRENIRWLRHQDGAEWITWGEKPLITKQPITRGQLLRLLEALGKEGA